MIIEILTDPSCYINIFTTEIYNVRRNERLVPFTTKIGSRETSFTKIHVSQHMRFDNGNSQKQKLRVWCILDTHPSTQATPLRT